MDDVLHNALAFARHGRRVVPLYWPVQHDGRLVCSCRKPQGCLSPGKHPYGPLAPHGLLSASAESGVIKHWFGHQVPEANYGVACSSDLFALDIDPRRDGDETLAALEREHGPLPRTWRTISGSGGEHILFNAEGLHLRRFSYNPQAADRNQPLGIGIDAPHYIVGPGSLHICGRRYEWNVDHHPADTPLATPPQWLIDLLVAPIGARDPVTWAAYKAGIITEYRDQAAAAVAGKLLRAVSLDPAFAVTLIHAWNTVHCRPPIPEDELSRIIDRIARREIARLAG